MLFSSQMKSMKVLRLGMLGLLLLISTFFPRKIDDLSFSGFQSPYRIFNAFQSILLRIWHAGRGLSKHHEASIHDGNRQ